ncbi:MAG: alpha-L-fucosidase, partial [Phycisphaerae bacterium]
VVAALFVAGMAATAAGGDALGEKTRQLMLKAVAVKPHPRQVRWQESEFSCFIHFGVNTFTGREWGSGKEDPKVFNPAGLDTDQWCRAMKAAGMKLVVFTCKHHDGFCLWQTRYTKHSVASSPWRGGRGDVLGDLAASCRKHGLKLGVYLSPADLYQIESPDGLYGNLSEYSVRTIPRPVAGRALGAKRSFRYRVDDYNEYFMNQLFELLTEYGAIHEVWFDGAHPKRKGGQRYTYNQWYEMIHELQPDAAIAVKGPDVRWCGNEAGHTRPAEWSVIPIGGAPDKREWPDMRANELGSLSRIREALDRGGRLHWYPAETNTSIRRGWFWRDERQGVRSAEEMLDIWYRSVGGNTVFLLNVPPNRDGLFAERDRKVLEEVGRCLRETFSDNLADGAAAAASATRGAKFGAKNVLDGNAGTCWMPADWTTSAELVVTLAGTKTFNRVVLQEQIADHSQRIAKFAVDANVDGRWRQIAEGTTVGYKRICRTETVATDKVRIRVLDSRVCPTISGFGLYLQPARAPSGGTRRTKTKAD